MENRDERRHPAEVGGGPADRGSDHASGYAAATDWPLAAKTVVSSILLLGFEIMLIPAVALMGKDNFDRIWAGAIRLLKTLKPARGVSRRRYTIGLYMLVGATLYAWIASYAPSWLPEDYVLRV